jgi:hypothetical protein
MAASVRVSCINKSDRMNPHERIKNIGGVNADGTRWNLPEDKAIAGIRSGQWTFYVTVGSNTVNVIIANHLGRDYLKTVSDGIRPDNLLSLPECPV